MAMPLYDARSDDLYQIIKELESKDLDDLLKELNFSSPIEFLEAYDYEIDETYVHHLSRTASTILALVYVIVFTLGLLGNSLVIALVVRKRSMRTVINIFVASLAIADLFIILFGVPFTLLEQLTAEWVLGKFMCKALNYFTQVCVASSVLTMIAIAIERHRAICYPLRPKVIHTPEKAFFVSVVVWIIPLILNLPTFTALEIEELEHPLNHYVYHFCAWKSQEQEKRTSLTIMLSLYVMPLTLMTYLYLQIVFKLWMRKPVAPLEMFTRFHVGLLSNTNMRNKKRATKMLITVVLLYAICWLPYHILILFRDFHYLGLKDTERNRLLMAFCQLLGLSNSSNNPVVYGFMNDKFKSCIIKIVQNVQSRRKSSKKELTLPRKPPSRRSPAIVTAL